MEPKHSMPCAIFQLCFFEQSFSQGPQTIYDWGDEHALTDVLYKRAFRPQKCEKKCMGSAMDHLGEGSNKHMPLEKKLSQAAEFLVDYYQDLEHHERPAMGLEERQEEVRKALEEDGFYRLTKDELVWGARTAWRNAPRCPARVIWKNLIVFDCRQLSDTDMMFLAICRHLEVTYKCFQKYDPPTSRSR